MFRVKSQKEQIDLCLRRIRSIIEPLDQYSFLMDLLDRNQRLFYRVNDKNTLGNFYLNMNRLKKPRFVALAILWGIIDIKRYFLQSNENFVCIEGMIKSLWSPHSQVHWIFRQEGFFENPNLRSVSLCKNAVYRHFCTGPSCFKTKSVTSSDPLNVHILHWVFNAYTKTKSQHCIFKD